MATVIAFVTATAACSDDSSESQLRTQRWIEEADEICEEENAALEELEVPAVDPFDETLTAAQLEEIVAYLDRALEIEADMTARLDDLGLPPDGGDEIEDVLEQRRLGRAAVEQAIEFARDGNAEAFTTTYREAVTEYDRATRGAREFGLEECGQ
jgi:hypothetical protein